MRNLLVAFILSVCFLCPSCATMGGDPKVSLPQLEALPDDQFAGVLVQTQRFAEDVFMALILTEAVKVEDLEDFKEILDGILAADVLVNDPHAITNLVKAKSPKGQKILATVRLVEDFIRMRWDIGPIGDPLSPRTRKILETVSKAATSWVQDPAEPQPQAL